MGNSSSGQYSPGSNSEEACANNQKILFENISKYPQTAELDFQQATEGAKTIAKEGLKGAFVGANASLVVKNPLGCAISATTGATWYAKDAALSEALSALNRGTPIEVTKERQWLSGDEETKKDEE